MDTVTVNYAEALKDADLLIVCVPVDVIPSIIEEAVKYAKSDCIITDVGSTKERLIGKVEPLIPENMSFVGAHPIAGSHRTGVEAAYSSLFDDSICIITPTKFTSAESTELIAELWQLMRSQVKFMSPEEHDLLIAAASHLPHAAASALSLVVDGIESNNRRALDFAGTGFRDTTRIAAGSPELWTGIFLQNADMVSLMLQKLENELAEMRELLRDMDRDKLMEKLVKAKDIRDLLR